MGAIVLSQLFGLAAKILIARAFGTGLESEAYFAANRFSEILFNLVAGGALGSAFIPTLTGMLAKEDRLGAWKLISALANWVTLVLTVVGVLSAIFAPQVVHYLLAPGFTSSDPAKEALTAHLLRLQLPSAVIFGLSGLVMGSLNAHRHFLMSALAPSMYSIGLIFGAVVLVPLIGVDGLAVGVVLGALLHLLIQIPMLLRLPQHFYRLTLGLHEAATREVGRLMAPRLVGVAVVQLNFLLNTYLASFQPEGSLTGITLGFALMMMPQAAIAQSIAIASLPTFSAQAALGKLDEMRTSLGASLRGVLLLALPASVGLVMLRVPVVRLVYERGEFTAQSTQIVAWALLWYAVGLVGHSVVEIVARAFYALHDTKTPVVIGIAAMSLNLGFSLVFTALFSRLGWMPHGGLALANSLATALEMVGLLVLMRRRLSGLDGRNIWIAVGKSTIATGVLVTVVLFWMNLTQTRHAAIVVAGAVVLGGGAYVLMLVLLKVKELSLFSGLAKRLLRR